MKDKTTNWDEIGYLISTCKEGTFTYAKIPFAAVYV